MTLAIDDPKPARRNWAMHGLTCLIIAASLIDRSTLSVAMPAIGRELSLSGVQIGLVFSAFLWTYAFVQVPAALLVDRLGIRRVIFVAALAWTVITGLTGLTTGFASLILFRVALGIAEAPVFPAAIKVVHGWFAPRHRGRALAIIETVVKLGFAVSPAIGVVLVARFGWRPMFYVLAAISVVPTLLWFLHFRDPVPASSAGDPPRRVGLRDWLGLFGHARTWLLIAGGLTTSAMLAIAYWLPIFLKARWAFDLPATGKVMTLIGAAGVLGALVGGFVADARVRRGASVIAANRGVIALGLLASAATLAVANHASTATVMIAALTANSFVSSLIYAPAWSLAAAVAPRPTLVASMGGMQNCGVAAGAGLSTLAIGALVDRTGGFAIAFDLCALLAVVAAAIYGLLIRDRALRPAIG